MSLLAVRERVQHADPRPVGACGPDPAPRLTTTVPREYVHRASLAEVFLTGCEDGTGHRFALTAQWPRAHTFFQSLDGSAHDCLLAAETVRQAGIYLSHSRLGVPLDHHFAMHDLRWTVDPDQLAIGVTPTDLQLHAVCRPESGPGRGAKNRYELEVDVWRGAELAGTCQTRFTCLTPAVYRRLRGELPPALALAPARADPASMSPALVGRAHARDVVIARTERPGRWRLIPDPRHPILFDHWTDHVPGMVLMEAARQASCALSDPGSGFVPISMASEFQHYVEFDSPCWIEATPLPDLGPGQSGFLVTGEQEGRMVYRAEVIGRAAERADGPALSRT